jgi:hypothetical protein
VAHQEADRKDPVALVELEDCFTALLIGLLLLLLLLLLLRLLVLLPDVPCGAVLLLLGWPGTGWHVLPLLLLLFPAIYLQLRTVPY